MATPFLGELCDCHELTGDGIMDLSMKFKSADVVDALEKDGGVAETRTVKGVVAELRRLLEYTGR